VAAYLLAIARNLSSFSSFYSKMLRVVTLVGDDRGWSVYLHPSGWCTLMALGPRR
jgi:hypothetical protein